MKRNKKFLMLGLLSTVAVLLALIFVGFQREDALAQEAGKQVGPPTLLAVTGACGIGAEVGVLYLIDSEKKQLAVYTAFGGRDIRFVAARKIFYDFELLDANDSTPKAFKVRNLKRAYEKSRKGKDGEKTSEPRRR